MTSFATTRASAAVLGPSLTVSGFIRSGHLIRTTPPSPARHRGTVSHVTVNDLKWMCERVRGFTDAPCAFRAARYDDQTRRFVDGKQKAAEGMALR